MTEERKGSRGKAEQGRRGKYEEEEEEEEIDEKRGITN